LAPLKPPSLCPCLGYPFGKKTTSMDALSGSESKSGGALNRPQRATPGHRHVFASNWFATGR
jgi:hypothetical protein